MNDTDASQAAMIAESGDISDYYTPRILKAKVTADDLRRGLEALDKLGEDQHDELLRGLCFVGLLGKDRPPEDNDAVHWRLNALESIAARPEFSAFSSGIGDAGRVDPNVLAVAADEPLTLFGPTGFEPDSFFMRLLALTEGHGRG